MSKISLTSNDASLFDQIKHIDTDGSEYWLARQLQPLLGYSRWQRFEETIGRAKLACQNSGYDIKNHFTDDGNLVKRPQGGGSRQSDYRLSRYACYLTAMNGDPRKPQIASAQSYFAVKTREAELAPQLEFEKLYQIIEEQGRAIALLQSQIQNLLPISTDFMPPGWDVNVWEKLQPQDKRHFRYIFRRRGFRPSHQGKDELKALPFSVEEIKQKQQAEMQQLVGEVSTQEKEKLEAAKQEALRKFWLQEEDVAF